MYTRSTSGRSSRSTLMLTKLALERGGEREGGEREGEREIEREGGRERGEREDSSGTLSPVDRVGGVLLQVWRLLCRQFVARLLLRIRIRGLRHVRGHGSRKQVEMARRRETGANVMVHFGITNL